MGPSNSCSSPYASVREAHAHNQHERDGMRPGTEARIRAEFKDLSEDDIERIVGFAKAGYAHGLQGFYPDGDYSSDADWCHGVGDDINKFEGKHGYDAGEAFDVYCEAHGEGLYDGGHENADDEGC